MPTFHYGLTPWYRTEPLWDPYISLKLHQENRLKSVNVCLANEISSWIFVLHQRQGNRLNHSDPNDRLCIGSSCEGLLLCELECPYPISPYDHRTPSRALPTGFVASMPQCGCHGDELDLGNCHLQKILMSPQEAQVHSHNPPSVCSEGRNAIWSVWGHYGIESSIHFIDLPHIYILHCHQNSSWFSLSDQMMWIQSVSRNVHSGENANDQRSRPRCKNTQKFTVRNKDWYSQLQGWMTEKLVSQVSQRIVLSADKMDHLKSCPVCLHKASLLCIWTREH